MTARKTQAQELQEYARQVGLYQPPAEREEAPVRSKISPRADNLIKQKESPRDNFTIVPNLLDVIGLSPIAFRLYVHIRRRAGESGKCWESAHNMANFCAMSTFAVHKAKKELAELGLISIENKKRAGGGKDYHEITVQDIWQLNRAYFSGEIGEQCILDTLQCIPG
jgi:hypothetical protein